MTAYRVVNAIHVLTESARGALEARGCEVRDVPLVDLTPDAMNGALAGVQAVIAGGERYTDSVFHGAPQLQIVARAGAGVDSVDLDAAARHGVWVTNTPGATNHAVADLTIGLILCLLRRIPQACRALKDGAWVQPQGTEFGSLVLGVVGTGGIGREVIRRAVAFGSRVLANDLRPDQEFARSHGVEYVGLEELLTKADIVSLHVGLSDSTRNLLSRERLGWLKRGSFLVNTSRPAIVDTETLIEKLRDGSLAGAAIDVHDPVPADPKNPLIQLDNVIATPWYAYKTDEAIHRMCDAAVRDVLAVLDGKRPRFPVNEPETGAGKPVPPGS